MSPLRHESRKQTAAPPSGGRRTRDRGPRNRCRLQAERFEDRRLLTTITVTGVGDTVANDGVVTLREAILAANTNSAVGDAKAGTPGLDTIAFDIPCAGVHAISLTSPRPTITDPIVIDGFTRHDSHPNTNPLDKADNALPLIEPGSAARLSTRKRPAFRSFARGSTRPWSPPQSPGRVDLQRPGHVAQKNRHYSGWLSVPVG